LRKRFPTLAAGGIHALTGKAVDIQHVTDALGYRYAFDPEIGQYAHDAAIAVLGPDGHLSRWLYGLAPDPGDLKLALTEAGQGQTGDWGDQLLLLCYHYDPVTGQYSLLIWRPAAGRWRDDNCRIWRWTRYCADEGAAARQAWIGSQKQMSFIPLWGQNKSSPKSYAKAERIRNNVVARKCNIQSLWIAIDMRQF